MAARTPWTPGPPSWKDDLTPISTADWNYGSVLALWLVAVVVVLMVVFGRYLSADLQEREAT